MHPVMVVMGNPPYSGISSNNGKWISDLIEDYKYVDGEHFKERKHWLNDDYVKFMRFGQHFIDKNGSGILAFINPHGFLDNPTFRGMRWNLMQSFDEIYTIDLHGNSKKKETAPDGSADVNVFDIQQGVSINIFVKTGKKKAKELGQIFHYDLFGKRDLKYDFLSDNSLKDITFQNLKPNAPNYFFIPKNDDGRNEYENGFKVNLLFTLNNTGIVTGIDKLSVFPSKYELKNTVERILSIENPYDEYKIKDSRRTSKEGRIEDLRIAYQKGIIQINYRPFDIQYTLPFDKNEFWINSPRVDVMQHFLKGENVGLITAKQSTEKDWTIIQVTKNIIDNRCQFSYKGIPSIFPLYLYPEKTAQQNLLETNTRTPNLNPVIVKQIAEGLGLTFTNEKTTPSFGHPSNGGELAPIDLLDYIYAVLHSPSYREKYKEFLKIDFPRVPYPKDSATFWQLVKLGGELRQIHLLESPIVEKYITQYPEDGNNIVTKPTFVKNPTSNSPPLEGCPTGGVVPNTTSQNEINPHTAPHNFMDPNTFIKNNSIYFNPILELPYNIKLKARAKELRQAENLSEVLFWMQVTKDQFYKIDFDRQRIIGNYIVDFYVKKLGLVIEIDGASHDTKAEYDKVREDYLLSLGLKVYRIPVVEVLQNMKGVMRNLEEFIIENYGKPLVNSSKDKNPPHPAGTPPKEGNLKQLTKKEDMGRLYINEMQYFANVPEVAWNFYIGGYQPCQKWLKDRKGRELNYDDILHYQKIVVALSETDRIMKEIDKIEI